MSRNVYTQVSYTVLAYSLGAGNTKVEELQRITEMTISREDKVHGRLQRDPTQPGV